MITIHQEKCSGCKLCARICHEHAITHSSENGSKVESVNHTICSTCTQCVAVCPQRVLMWDDVPAVKFDRKMLPSAEQMRELFQQRRTTRHFKDKKVARELSEEIANIGIYAPTNNYKLRAIILDSPEILKELDAIVMGFVRLLYNICYRSDLMFNTCRRLSKKIDAKSRVKIRKGLEKGHDYGSLYTTTIFIVGDGRILLSEASAQYALYNIILYAQAKGLGSRIQASGTVTLNRSKKARKILGLNKREEILATVELGYPSVRFSNKVQGKRLPITWLGDAQNG